MLILAGDIGGTNGRLRIVRLSAGVQTVVREATLPSRDFATLQSLLLAFLQAGEPLQAVALGIAAPVVEGAARTTNLPWPTVTERELQAALGVPVQLLNDLAATAMGVLTLPPEELTVVQAGVPGVGPRAVIAPGTGLGQAIIWQADGRSHVQATEGGHTEFGPQDDADLALWQMARKQWPHVSWERVVSGPGLHVIWECLTTELGEPACHEVTRVMAQGGDVPAAIGRHGVANACPTCGKAVRWLVRLLGAQAGNLALTTWPVSGVYVAGGLTAHLWPVLFQGAFLQGFHAKGRYDSHMRDFPVFALRDGTVALRGATQAALNLAQS
jgi:glucokinase